MDTKIGIGFSSHSDNETAAKEAAFQSKTNLNADKIDIAIIFSTIHYDPYIIMPTLKKLLHNAKMMGCSTAGIILSDSIKTQGVAVLTMSSEKIRFGISEVNDIKKRDAHLAGTILAKQSVLDFGHYSRAVFLFFVDNQVQNTPLMLKGMQEIFGNIFPIVGAGASDDFHYKHSFQIFNDQVLENSATGLMIGGNTSVGIGGKHGWRPLGKPRYITKSNENIIQTIDGQKASHIYEEFIGSETENIKTHSRGNMAILYPLGIYVEETDEYLIKNAIDIPEDGSIVCHGTVQEGSEIHLMIGNKDSCKQAAHEAAYDAHKALLGKEPVLILIIESMTRLKLLGRGALQEVQKVQEVFGTSVPILGMYSTGEICPFQTEERFNTPYFQNESIIIVAIS